MNSTEKLLLELRERAKELNCLYEVEKNLNQVDLPMNEIMAKVVAAIPPGWQFPDFCAASVTIEDESWTSRGYRDAPVCLQTGIEVQGDTVGRLKVVYTGAAPINEAQPFLPEEERLIRSLADRLGHYALFKKMQKMGRKWNQVDRLSDEKGQQDWRLVVDLLRETDDALFLRLSRKMLNFLCAAGVDAAQKMLREIDHVRDPQHSGSGEVNVPEERLPTDKTLLMTGQPFELAAHHLTGDEINSYVQRWIQADKASLFLNVVESPRSSLSEVHDALRRFKLSDQEYSDLPPSTVQGLRVALVQRVLTNQLDFVQAAKNHMGVNYVHDFMDRIITTGDSRGKLGGKASGMLLAHCILSGAERGPAGAPSDHETVPGVKIPKTWHIASDAILDFIAFNDLEDVLHQKYKPMDEVRRDYPHLIRLFKNSSFPPNLVHGLSSALDDFGDRPLIVRSSSLLEDRMGAAFSGKYKSLFLPNQGTKQERLSGLLDAVAEIYASMFGPDPIEYRHERGILEFDEQMAVLIQEVVGTRVGPYFLPAFAGVAFSKNEFRWSPRIQREDGLVRLVPGLGTRAVDRTGNDYPVLVVPDKPQLRVNQAVDEIVRYSPRFVDVINLEENSFETVEIRELLEQWGADYPALAQVFSVLEEGRFTPPVTYLENWRGGQAFATFEGLRGDPVFLGQIRKILTILEEELNTPVDVEFAHDGQDLYLLQCRPQSQANATRPDAIPQDLPWQDVVFSANRFVSNARMEEIRYVVYVDPESYGRLPSKEKMKEVGQAVGRLNRVLPRKQFILLGPGRWGSRGDIRLGVNVTYADINNTGMLVEIARQKGQYVPDVSFGTHFFQDLVEAGIAYLPLYPDEEENAFAESFLLKSRNLLAELAPQHADLEGVVRVIDVARETGGRILRVLLNADLDQAVACFEEPGARHDAAPAVDQAPVRNPIQYWQWRNQMAERIAREVKHQELGVEGMYLFGSVKNGIAGPASDIDILVHFRGTEENRTELLNWLDGWSKCLDEMNYLKTGYRTGGLLDVHLVTDEDISRKTSYAIKIDSVTDPAQPLRLGGRPALHSNSRLAVVGCSGSKRTRARAGLSLAAEMATVRPRRVCHSPVRVRLSWTWPCRLRVG